MTDEKIVGLIKRRGFPYVWVSDDLILAREWSGSVWYIWCKHQWLAFEEGIVTTVICPDPYHIAGAIARLIHARNGYMYPETRR